jgi:1,5-anhydro-D-fructose reductase (1,5-anhydro-D-mannitol-forming)
VKVGVLSFAHTHASGYAAALVALGVEVLAADPGGAGADPGQARGADLAAQIGIDYVDSYAELWAWRPDAVVVTSENAGHRALVEDAAAHGVDVLCEKPLATTFADAEAMVAACRRAGVRLAVAYPVRFSRAYAALRASVRAGGLGRVLLVAGANNGRLPAGSRRWFVDPVLAGGGALMDHTVHIADLLDELFDGCPATEVYARSNNVMYPDSVEVETAALVTVRYRNGVVATIDCSWSQPLDHPRWGGVELQVVGTDAIVEMDAFGQLVTGFDERGRRPVALPWGDDLDAGLLRAFLFAASPTGVAPADGDAGLRSLQVALAARESARRGRPVAVV